jgi:hypothetical protein
MTDVFETGSFYAGESFFSTTAETAAFAGL